MTGRTRSIATHVTAAAVGAGLLWLALRPGGAFSWVGQRDEPLDPVTTPAAQYAWTEQPKASFPIPPYARHLAGVKIVLDPGHGGRGDRANWKRGPTGLREAEINLRVAHFLREFLGAGGAAVVLTRQGDEYLDVDETADLRKRIELANELRADLFLSIHHNGSDDPEANYTALFYHASPDESWASLCAARYLLSGVNDALRLERDVPCALLSDQLLYEEGLLVLREARVPAVMAEGSFHSNPAEEQRLRDALYNRREAYGYFLGLARWARAGLPRVALLEPNGGTAGWEGPLVVALDDGLSARGGWGNDAARISTDSLVVKINDEPVPYTSDVRKGRLQIAVPRKFEGKLLRPYVDFENVFGQHVLHPWLEVPGRGG